MRESWRISFSVSFAIGRDTIVSGASTPLRVPLGLPQFAWFHARAGRRVARYGCGVDGKRSALVTGGTGGLGAAVVTRLLDDGWRVVVPWVAERELERVERREGLELVQADLFEQQAVAEAVALAAGSAAAPLRAVVNLVGGFAQGARVAEEPIEQFE